MPPIRFFVRIFPLLLSGILFLPACARLSLSIPLPPGVTVTPVASLALHAPFACDPVGGKVAFASDGLRLFENAEGEVRLLATEEPSHLAWSPDGDRLAAVFPHGDGAELRLLSSDGRVSGATRIKGRVTGLGWGSASELLVAGVELDRFTFGATLRETLYRWDGMTPPVVTPLYGISLMRASVQRYGELLPTLLTLGVSPEGDAVVYTRFRDPPAFTPYLELVFRHLGSGAEWQIATVSLASGGGLIAPSGALLYGDGASVTRLLDPWGGRELGSFPASGQRLARSPGGSLTFLDGRLYREGREIARFPADAAGCFARRGAELIVRTEERLYRVAGLPPEKIDTVPTAERERIATLRSWRSQGLITPDEYLKALERNDAK